MQGAWGMKGAWGMMGYWGRQGRGTGPCEYPGLEKWW